MSERIIVTGAAGFVGGNIVRGLNARGITNVIAVDNLTSADKFHNLVDLQISDYSDKSTFYDAFASGRYGHVDAVFHEGACSDTMQHDGRYMLDNNYASSKTLLDACMATGTRLFYASSAATYGGSSGSSGFIEHPAFERPLNVYGYSKLLFDQVVRRALPASRSQIAGFRYFNVYGPGEQHKGRMASVAYHHFNQFRAAGQVQLFGSYGPGEQMRDFVFIDDVVAVNLWFFDHPDRSGVFNLGSGRAQPFNDVALSTVNAIRASQKLGALGLDRMVAERLIEYVEFPSALHGKYQCFTEANLHNLRAAGCDHVFADVEKGVSAYVERLLGLEKDAATL